MSIRLRLALTVLFTGLATALGVIVAVGLAFERFEREGAYARADAFLERLTREHDDLVAQQRREPEAVTAFLRSLIAFEPDAQLYLLAPDGTVLASSGARPLAPGFRVAIGPVREAAAAAAAASAAPARSAAYVMGDDPEYMELDAVVAARALRETTIRRDAAVAGYLYVVCRKPGLPPSRLARFAANLAGPALGPVLAVILLATLLTAWVIAAVTRRLAVLTADVMEATRQGFAARSPWPERADGGDDEVERLRGGFAQLMRTLRAQWEELRRLDAFRRESISSLSHDLRSPLTAAVAGLETLQRRWGREEPGAAAPNPEDRRLVEVALRNTETAARLVRALGDLAVLDEAQYRLRPVRVNLAEVLDDIVMRFADRAATGHVALVFEPAAPAEPLPAEVDIELFERAVANLLDNALRFTPAGGRITLAADSAADGGVHVVVHDTGCGIAEEDLGHLFERHYQGRAPAAAGAAGAGTQPGAADGARGTGNTGGTGKGLGLAIVQRIVELHRGRVDVTSRPGQGTRVTIALPPADHPPRRERLRSLATGEPRA